MNKLNILLLGGTGLIGTEVLKSIPFYSDMGKAVVWARSTFPLSNPDSVTIQMVTWDELLAGSIKFPESVDAVICCLGTTIKKAGSQEKFREIDYNYPLLAAKLAFANGVKSYLLVSAMGADPNSSIFYNRVKGELERELAGTGFSYLGIFRPSLLIGNRKETRFGERIGYLLSFLIPFALFGLKKYKPIRGEFVARSMIKSLVLKSRALDTNISPIVEIIENDKMLILGKDNTLPNPAHGQKYSKTKYILLSYLVHLIIIVWYFFVRKGEVIIPESAQKYIATGGNYIIAVFHETTLSLYRHATQYLQKKKNAIMVALVSQSKDGEIIHQTFARSNLNSVRGSSTRGGTGAFRELLKLMKRGHVPIFTVDGPKGPRHEVKPGVIATASLTGAPILYLDSRYDRFWQFKSWDRHFFPKFGAKLYIRYGEPLIIPKGLKESEIDEWALKLEAKMKENRVLLEEFVRGKQGDNSIDTML